MSAPSPASQAEALNDPELRARLEDLMGAAAVGFIAGLQDQSPATEPPATPDPAGALDLALQSGFTPDALSAGTSLHAWAMANSALLPGTAPRMLRITEAARVRLLAQAPEALAGLLARHAEADATCIAAPETASQSDRVSAWLRQFLRPKGHEIRPGDLRAMAEARAMLASTPLAPSVPGLDEMERQRGLAELLDPLALMIGRRPGQTGDRFAGRNDELRDLRGFVDVLASHSVMEAVVRYARRKIGIIWGHNGPRLLTLTARGGLGKSTLMAKFVFDHALQSDNRFPFAYLDFDLAALTPRDPMQLLVEVSRQIALQFPQVADRLMALCAAQRSADIPVASKGTANPFDDFRGIIADLLTLTGAEVLLVVLDTLEIVQADPTAMEVLAGFVHKLGTGSGGPFRPLRIVAAGRADLNGAKFGLDPDGPFEVRVLPLEPLTLSDAQEMVQRLGEDLLPKGWQPGWSVRLAGRRSDGLDRREPLSLRLATELVVLAAPEARAATVAAIGALGEDADKSFVARLYLSRTLDHLREPEAKAIAWPGLVLRCLDAAMVTEVVAPVAKLDPAAALRGFEILKRETWIVDAPGPDGMVRHRRDLRARTLPLMRRHDSAAFDQVLAAVIPWLAARAATDPVAARELGYYRLLRGDAADLAANPVPEHILLKLEDARSDMLHGSAGWAILEVHFEARPMSQADLDRLPDDFLWQHIARAGGSLRTQVLRRIDPRTNALLSRNPPTASHGATPDARAAWQSLVIRAGAWQRLDDVPLIVPAASDDLALLLWYLGRLSVASPDVTHGRIMRQDDLEPGILRALEAERWQARALALPLLRLINESAFLNHDAALVRLDPGQAGLLPGAMTALETAIHFGFQARQSCLPLWIGSQRVRIRSGLSAALEGWLLALGPLQAPGHPEAAAAQIAALPPQIITDPNRIARADAALDRLSGEIPQEHALNCVQPMLGLDAGDWALPLGHALSRAMPRNWKAEAASALPKSRYATAPQGWLGKPGPGRSQSQPPKDVLALLDEANRAADLDAAISALSRITDPEKAEGLQDLRHVLRVRSSWLQAGAHSSAEASGSVMSGFAAPAG